MAVVYPLGQRALPHLKNCSGANVTKSLGQVNSGGYLLQSNLLVSTRIPFFFCYKE